MASRPLEKVLYVEDEDDIRTIGQMAMEKIAGFRVRACASGAEALDAVAEFGPDLVVLDVMMPGMDGPEVLRALRANPDTAALPVVFMTAKVLPSEVARFREMGVAEVIRKPFDPMALGGQMEAIWKRLPE